MMETYLKNMKAEWVNLLERTDEHIRLIAADVGKNHARLLSQEFYTVVLTDSQAAEFLSNEQVERQLKAALARWIAEVLACQIDDVERLIEVQQTIAAVHARIGISVELVEMGFRVLKKLLYPVINSADYAPAEKLQVYHFTINSIDLAMEVMSRAFSFTEHNASKEDENYRIFSLLENAEEEKERQIASLLAWEIDLVYRIVLDADLGNSLSLSQADFGLWFNHKGRHYFSGIAEAGHISRLIQDIDEVFRNTRETTKALSNRSLRTKFLIQLRKNVSQISTLLRELFENIAAVHGEGLSGACLEISGDGKLLDATVAGKEIEDSKEYKVATLDYLAEGNDHITAFAKVGDADKLLPEKATVRQLFLNYVNEQTKARNKTGDNTLAAVPFAFSS